MTGALVPACGGCETPFTVNGRTWLYCWDPDSGRHYYLDVDNDIVVVNRNFHPAWSPELEHMPEQRHAPDTARPVNSDSSEEIFYF